MLVSCKIVLIPVELKENWSWIIKLWCCWDILCCLWYRCYPYSSGLRPGQSEHVKLVVHRWWPKTTGRPLSEYNCDCRISYQYASDEISLWGKKQQWTDVLWRHLQKYWIWTTLKDMDFHSCTKIGVGYASQQPLLTQHKSGAKCVNWLPGRVNFICCGHALAVTWKVKLEEFANFNWNYRHNK